ncbi:expressed unknown protein [Seminavis robusta]|uniref:Uncharacterized protein n=1 Tax=Seminavis robusta TaxID=568900 RepID=A0A9N8EX78_9STRA|nr:expressed unknown protein [Seminavis robusta]|eukprot:Sro1965_g308270.1 n/a (236) ;mRNA; r:6271-6978
MKLCDVYLTLLVVFTAVGATDGFSPLPTSRQSNLPVVPVVQPPPCFRLFGILDEINNGGASSSSEDDEQFDSLFNDLIFCTGDTKAVIADRLESCSDPDFLQWLEWNMEESEDDEEAQALQDLLEMIDQVATETQANNNNQQAEQERRQEEQAKKQQEMESQQASDTTDNDTGSASATSSMSAADLLKKANAIDQAVMIAEASDDEKPNDFMRDAKAERGLGGFNNKGRMRVGGG